MGFGIFNLVEGIIDHHLLGLHRVNETVPPEQWLWWDLAFLASGALLLVVGWALQRRRERRINAPQPVPGGRRRGDPQPA